MGYAPLASLHIAGGSICGIGAYTCRSFALAVSASPTLHTPVTHSSTLLF